MARTRPYKQKQARNRRQSTQHRATGRAKRSLRLRFSESPSNSAAIKTKKSAQSKRRNESYGRLKKGSRFLHWSQGKHGPDQSHNRLILLSLSADFNRSAQLQQFFCHSLCGPIWIIFGGPETQHGEVPPHHMTFFCLAEKNPNSQPKFPFVNSDFL